MTADGRRPAAPLPVSVEGRRVAIVVNTDWFFLSHRLPLALAARDAGADVWVVATDSGRRQQILDHELHFFDMRMTRVGRNPLREFATLVRLRRLFTDLRPDVVHLVSTKSICVGGIAATTAGVTGIVSAVTGVGYALGQGQSRSIRHFVPVLLRQVLQRSAVVLFQHDSDARQYQSRGLCRPEQTMVVEGVGVDMASWCVAPEPEAAVVMLAARLIEEKGVATFVEAARLLRPAHPTARFVIVGEPDVDLPTAIPASRLLAWADEGVVEWWGRREDMAATLAECQVFVLPTFHNEGVPKVLVEAAATGRPIVASDIPGCRAVVDEGVTGLLVPPKDPARLAHAIASLLDDAGLRRRMGAAGRTAATKRFDARVAIAATLTAYARAIAIAEEPGTCGSALKPKDGTARS